MDEVWQQNKKWILGVAGGFLLFWIATSIVTSIYDAEAAEGKAQKMSRAKGEFYDKKALREARQAAEALDGAKTRLVTELECSFDERFNLDGKGDSDLHFDQVARAVRSALVDKAQAYGVEMAADALEWDPPVGRDEIQRTLYGMAVLEQGVLRLLDAGDEVREADPDAFGLQTIENFEIAKKSSRNKKRRSRRRGRRSSDRIDASEWVEDYEVSFKFRGDAATLQLFLEKCRSGSPTLLLQGGLKLKAGRGRNDAAQITGRIVGLDVQEPVE